MTRINKFLTIIILFAVAFFCVSASLNALGYIAMSKSFDYVAFSFILIASAVNICYILFPREKKKQ